ncbi:DNA N-glycosylase and apurinic/apyrimidinic (AP) lyase [Mortierella sp. AD011]|nr:DNA N-glycosylase and apurinic/apyrimidinic (AP) lyase [Mortierella sp. AD010]KAF9391355.1 DNA N-glycosylase and apurinic/apyrimidinic (AP) lyase [Mortierella sp. AD011]
MSTRSSSRLRLAKTKVEQAESTPATTSKRPSRSTDNSSATLETDVQPTRRSTRSTRGIVKNEDGEPDELTLARLKLEADEHRAALAAERRNKRNSAAMASRSNSSKIKDEDESSVGGVVAKKSKYATKEPVGWEITLDRIREYRLANPAPVDTMGCERLAEVGEHIPPEVSRFQTLMSLVLSSQTKDTVTSVAIRRLQIELKGGLTIQGVLDVPSEELNNIISAVGFHNKKTIFMKQIAEICKTQYNGDIPGTPEDLIALPGVGPKMAYLTLQVAWKKNLGIGVDTHVHRIANRLGWIKTEKDGPEATREALQSWLPKAHWREINYILVGFGQTVCLPRGPRCGECPVQDRCPSATGVIRPKKKAQTAIKSEIEEPFGQVGIHDIHSNNDKVAEETLNIANGEVKKETEEDKSPYFTSSDIDAVVKKEEEENSNQGSVLGENLRVDSRNLEKESADIEDLVT